MPVGQTVKAKSVSIVPASDFLGQKSAAGSFPVVLSSDQITAVTNTILTAVFNSVLSALQTTLVDANDFVVAGNKKSVTPSSGDNPTELILTDNYISDVTINDGGTGYTAGSLIVDDTGTGGTGFAGTYTVDEDGVIDAIVITEGGSGYKSAPAISGDVGGSSADLEGVLSRDSRGIKSVNFSNTGDNTATFYVGIDDTVTTDGEEIGIGEELYNYPVDGLESLWIYATIEDEDLEYTEIKRRTS